jgi:hypothetical protein
MSGDRRSLHRARLGFECIGDRQVHAASNHGNDALVQDRSGERMLETDLLRSGVA